MEQRTYMRSNLGKTFTETYETLESVYEYEDLPCMCVFQRLKRFREEHEDPDGE
jgi:hypothetical protein